MKAQDYAALANLDMLVVHAYAGSEAAPFAERYQSCAVAPSSIGGASNIGMPIEVTFGGKRTTGTASVGDTGVSFTAE